ncbi:MAG: microcystin degradation protein MlrC [Gammaproteobacteria bacterium]|nr:microcystin degradation protein MlrC [Gammaproteobacteria bacterium]
MRIVVAMMKHETNTFSPIVTDWQRFCAWGAYAGSVIQDVYAQTRMPIAAYMKLARGAGATVITPVAAEAMPSGPVTEAAFEYMCGLICDTVGRGCDAVLLDLHGAMVCEHVDDGEGVLLERIRAIAPGIPIAVTCDLHCNLTPAMVQNCTALIGYKTYPHTDMYEMAEQVGQIVLDTVNGTKTPVTAWGRSQVLSQTLCQGTGDEPMRSLIAKCRTFEARKTVLAATVFGGFALADMADAGTSVIIVTDGDQHLADALRDELLHDIWDARESFIYHHRPLHESIAKARTLDEGPIILLDHADNCGSGGTQDVMTVIATVHAAGLEDVIVAAVWDPQAVQTMAAAGVGSEVEIDLGGNTHMPNLGVQGQPLRLRGRVKTLSDGRFKVHGPMYTGIEVHMGPSAVFDTGNMQIVVVSAHHEPWDLGVFTSMGIQPERHRYLLLKSRIHYRAGFGHLPKHTITLDGTGVTTSDNSCLNYRKLRRPMYPLDRINTS